MTQLSFFIGKGGVGKTTVSSAYAVHSALRHPREAVLLISTDPAHSLADIFQLGFRDSPRRIPTNKGKLFGWQINAEKQFGEFLDRHREAIFLLLESGTLFSRREIEPLLSTHLPGMAEMGALIAIHDLLQSQKYDRLVVDTAPLGHTLRLFEMPEHFLRFLDFLDIAGGRDAALAATFGGKARISHAFLQEWRRMVEGVQHALRSPGSRLVLVTTAESFALQESARAAKSLAQARLEIAEIVLNRVVLEKRGSVASAESCRRCSRTREMTRKAETFLKKHFPQAAIFRGEDTGAPVLGTKELAGYGAHVFAAKKFTAQSQPLYKGDLEEIEKRFRRCGWPILEVPLALTIGKGGVGKTTISSALAFAQRREQPRKSVTICSTDPAPSLDDVFQQEIGDQVTPVLGDPRLRAAELDSVAEFQRWSERIKETIERAFSGERRGIHVDMSFDRQLFSALLDIVPPGVDEIFAIFRILDLLENGTGSGKNAPMVIIDMAPTGHALELLRMPDRMLLWSRLLLKALAEHRSLPLAQDAAVEIASLGQRVRALARMLRDQRQALLAPVMLAEQLPDRETERLLAALKELGTSTSPVFVNRVLFARDVKGCPRCAKAREWQLATLGKQEERLGGGSGERLWIVRNFPEEVAGAGRLQSFTQELWQLQRPTSVKGMRRSKAGTRKR